MNFLNTEVSCFENCYASENPITVNLLTWLKSSKFRKEVELIREIRDKEQRDFLKKKLPVITPSGIFSKRNKNDLLEHSRLIQFDIDFKDNQHIVNYAELKSQISKIGNVAYCGLSVSGLGFWGLIPISDPQNHLSHFRALSKDFKQFGILIDQAPKSIVSLRTYSFDVDAYFNYDASIYTKLAEPKHQKNGNINNLHNSCFSNDSKEKKIADLISSINSRKIDITNTYETWFAIACALANEFGESGREYFHAISQYSKSYDFNKTEKQFNAVLKKNSNYTLATIFYHFKNHNH